RPFIEEHLLQVGPATPGNRPVLNLTADAEPEGDDEQPASLAAMFSLSWSEWQGEGMDKPSAVPSQPQAKRGKRRQRAKEN
ncbi:hypothetical protein V6C53_20140, partial [Desulfocurvibacter africanus]|uniref:hypothetical protein n=1 Tax=Desulfocurvibacter africanus TaxID=873 RepID=UPI002FDA1B1A